ncbi:13746_t:CDS:2 [Cetraspora pellucida]|uniref:13746_t:CDS:1 n=1 Tax=Cetraspora pellucida TaxID=1433469 RepID=A0A9N9F6Y8_9GLOM|nr:13746_t:CDS:2 [Cetraspora pellucida]
MNSYGLANSFQELIDSSQETLCDKTYNKMCNEIHNRIYDKVHNKIYNKVHDKTYDKVHKTYKRQDLVKINGLLPHINKPKVVQEKVSPIIGSLSQKQYQKGQKKESPSCNTFNILVLVQLSNKSMLSINALIDSDASACFHDYTLAHEYNLPVKRKNTSLSVEECSAHCWYSFTMHLATNVSISERVFWTQIFHVASVNRNEKTATLTLSIKYNNFSNVLDEKEADRLSEHRPYDCAIDLAPGKQLL